MATVEPKKPVFWIPDNSTEQCKLCGQKFGYLLRKHHCRRCGHIFCSSCACNFGSIPSYLPKTLHYSDVGNKVRLCTTCLVEINTAKKSRPLVEIISLIPIGVADLNTMRLVNKQWKEATNYILCVLKGIPYKITYDKFSKLEKRIIKQHWRAFTGHSKYMMQTIRCLCGIIPSEQLSNIIRTYKLDDKQMTCKHLFCTNCHETLEVFDIIQLIYGFPGIKLLENIEAECWIGSLITKIEIKWLSILIPYFLTIGVTEACQRLIHNYILPRIVEDTNFCFKFYYECRLCRNGDTRVSDYYVSLMERVLQMTTQERRDEFAKADMLIYYLENPHVDKQEKIDTLGDVVMPYSPDIIIKKVHLDKMKQLNTFTKPYVIPIDTNYGPKRLLIKKEDLRKDRLVVTIKYILCEIIPNIKLTPYNVFPIHGSYGWIQMLENVETLYDIEQRTTLQNYILERNASLSITQIRRNFIQTCGSNALLTYMIGVGDRNLHNILVTTSGDLVNIDFSYLLGDDPKFQNQEMSISTGMVQMLGGHESEAFSSFQSFCSEAFKKIRQYSSFWFVLCLYLSKTKPPMLNLYNDFQQIRKFHEQRLMCNLTEEECTVRITEIVNRNSNSSWHQYISEYSHGITTSIKNFIFDMEM